MQRNGSGNRLVHEISPYLQQHAAHPVDWYPWGEEALQVARREHKPIHLSIGYSACQGCRRMARESFEDAATAQRLNEGFINVKVDREERPDLDMVYQNAFQLLNGHPGGWPLTMVLSPDDRVPFFGATYVAKQARDGFPGFAELMQRLADFFRDRESEVRGQNERLLTALKAGPSRQGRSGYSLNPRPLQTVIEKLAQDFDADHGGFGRAPKFPQPGKLERLLRHWSHTRNTQAPDKKAAMLAKFSLQKMAEGGLYDHPDGGFFRYSSDAQWDAPVAEKMLCDNARLLALYAQAWRATDSGLFKRVAEQTAAWLLNQMRSPRGGFYTSLNTRHAPRRDEKILTAWNGLMIKGLACAGRHLQNGAYVAAAEQALDFIRAELWQDGRLLAVYKDGPRFPAYLDDYALLIDGVLELLQCRWRDGDLAFALRLADVLMEHFQDPRKQGGFYFTADDHEPLIQRPKPVFDGVLPAGNGIAAYDLIRLGYMTNSLRHLLAAERALKNAWPSLERNPGACCALLLALEEYYYPSHIVVIRASARGLETWRARCAGDFAPRRLTLAIPTGAGHLPEFLAQRAALDAPVAYVCQRNQCSAPIVDLAALQAQLANA